MLRHDCREAVRFEFLRNEKGTRAFKAGEIIFHDGEAGDVMYAVVEGEVEIRRATASSRPLSREVCSANWH